MGCLSELYSPPSIGRIPGDEARTVERMHPFRQVVVILPVLIPFQTFIGRIIGLAFVQPLSDPKAPI